MEKKSLDEKMARIEQKQNDWLEPMENWINYAQNIQKIARESDLLQKKVATKEIFGLNFFLASRAVRGDPQNQWAALCAAQKMVSQKSEVWFWCCILKIVRTYFAACGGEESPPQNFENAAEPHR